MLITITGKPGSGKTLNMTNECRRNFNNDNPLIKRLFYKIINKQYIYTINEYSNFPILLKKAKKNKLYYYYNNNNEVCSSKELFSFKVRIFDLRIKYKFNEGSNIYIDEIQAQYDSMEYKDFPDCIAHFFQAHRHLGINNIFCNSQSISRIIKRVLIITESFWNIISSRKILGFIITKYNIFYDVPSKDYTIIDETIDNALRIFKANKVYNMYETKYLKGLLDNSITYNNIMWNKKVMDYDDIMFNFFPTNEEREELKNERY